MSLWRLQSLIEGLPADSATGRLHATPESRWTTDQELLATLIETVDAASLRVARLLGKKGARWPKPVRVPRPWDTPSGPVPMSDPRAVAFFGGRVRFTGGDEPGR